MLDVQVQQIVGRHPFLHQKQRQVSNHLTGGGDFDDVAKESIHLGVGGPHFPPAVPQAHGRRLLAQIGVLPARNLVLINLGVP